MYCVAILWGYFYDRSYIEEPRLRKSNNWVQDQPPCGPAGDHIQAGTAPYTPSIWRFGPVCPLCSTLIFSTSLSEHYIQNPSHDPLAEVCQVSVRPAVGSPSFPQCNPKQHVSTCFRAWGFYFPDLVQRSFLSDFSSRVFKAFPVRLQSIKIRHQEGGESVALTACAEREGVDRFMWL